MYICTANKKRVSALCCSLYSCLRVCRVRIFASVQIIQSLPFSPLPHIFSLTLPHTYLLFITRLATEHSRLYALQPLAAPGQICKQHRKVLCVNPSTKHQQNMPQHIEATLQCHLQETKNMKLKNMGLVDRIASTEPYTSWQQARLPALGCDLHTHARKQTCACEATRTASIPVTNQSQDTDMCLRRHTHPCVSTSSILAQNTRKHTDM